MLNQKLIVPLNDKYRIISMNIDGYKRAKKICDLLVDNQFTCLIKAQQVLYYLQNNINDLISCINYIKLNLIIFLKLI